MTLKLVICLCVLVGAAPHAPALAGSVPFWGSAVSEPLGTPIDRLRKGQFLWMGGAVTAGPLVMVVSITEQRAYLYRNGVLIGAATVSTGRPGHATPVGVFTVLQKQKEHRSNIYRGAPMPYMERLTWRGVALHAGGLPGYPVSHGCIHLPSEFARQLFGVSTDGMTVVIGAEDSAPTRVAHPGYLAPVKAVGGQPAKSVPLARTEDERWQPQLSPSGPVSIVLSQQSKRVIVYRNGIEIGRARLAVSGNAPLVNHALVLTDGPSSTPDPYVPDPAKYRWLRIAVPGQAAEAGTQVDPAAVARIGLPAEFVTRVNGILTQGATLLVMHEALHPRARGSVVQVIDADPPALSPRRKPWRLD